MIAGHFLLTFELIAYAHPNCARTSIAYVRYIKTQMQLETIDITTRPSRYDIRICMVYTIKPRSDVDCFKLNFNISNVGYW